MRTARRRYYWKYLHGDREKCWKKDLDLGFGDNDDDDEDEG